MAELQTTEQQLRHHFLSWQCRIRQQAVRIQDGRPSEGMHASVIIDNHELAKLIVLINKIELCELVTEFRFMYKKTHDPAIRRDSLLKVLVAGYFQHAEEFSDRLTASLSAESGVATKLLMAEKVLLNFNQQNQLYNIPCSVKELSVDENEFQATFWHNSIFNPNLPPTIRVIAFDPDWENAHAYPLPNEFNSVHQIQ